MLIDVTNFDYKGLNVFLREAKENCTLTGCKIYVKGNAGYRAGIYMKQYEDKIPVMVIGGTAG